MVSGSDPVTIAVMQIIQAALETIGFTLEIEQVEAATFQGRLVDGDFGVALGQMGGGQLSLARVTQNSFWRTSNNPLWPDGEPPEDYVQAMADLVSAEDAQELDATYTLLNDSVVDEAWVIGAYYVPTIFMFAPDVEGVARDHQNAIVLTDASA